MWSMGWTRMRRRRRTLKCHSYCGDYRKNKNMRKLFTRSKFFYSDENESNYVNKWESARRAKAGGKHSIHSTTTQQPTLRMRNDFNFISEVAEKWIIACWVYLNVGKTSKSVFCMESANLVAANAEWRKFENLPNDLAEIFTATPSEYNLCVTFCHQCWFSCHFIAYQMLTSLIQNSPKKLVNW